MKLKYRESESYTKPELIDTTSSISTVYLRKNIKEISIKSEFDEEERIKYVYDEAKLTKEEYKQYIAEMNIEAITKDVENLKETSETLTLNVGELVECILEMSEIIYA